MANISVSGRASKQKQTLIIIKVQTLSSGSLSNAHITNLKRQGDVKR